MGKLYLRVLDAGVQRVESGRKRDHHGSRDWREWTPLLLRRQGEPPGTPHALHYILHWREGGVKVPLTDGCAHLCVTRDKDSHKVLHMYSTCNPMFTLNRGRSRWYLIQKVVDSCFFGDHRELHILLHILYYIYTEWSKEYIVPLTDGSGILCFVEDKENHNQHVLHIYSYIYVNVQFH